MRILVTGGAGYIGSQTARQLAGAGHDVVVLDDLARGHADAVRGLPLVVGDVRDAHLVAATLREHSIEAVIHFAALKSVEESNADPGAYFDVNVGGTLTVLRAMAATGVGAFVLSSSAAVYGPPVALPVEESAPLRPLNPYGESKLMAERLLPWFETSHGIRYAALRYFNAAGADPGGAHGEDWRTAPNLIPIVLSVAAGRRPVLTINGMDHPTPDGSAIRDYIHVADLADAHIRAVDAVTRPGGSFTLNIGTGRGASVLEVVDAARRITGREIPTVYGPRRVGDPPAVWAATGAATERLGWHAAFDLDDVIGSAWRWYEGHPAGYGDPALLRESGA